MIPPFGDSTFLVSLATDSVFLCETELFLLSFKLFAHAHKDKIINAGKKILIILFIFTYPV